MGTREGQGELVLATREYASKTIAEQSESENGPEEWKWMKGP